MTVEKGWILEGFQFTPSISWTWMHLQWGKKKHWLEFSFLWWYIVFAWEHQGPEYFRTNADVDKDGNVTFVD